MSDVLWARAKWYVGKDLIDDVLPNKWIDEENEIVFWPNKNSNEAMLKNYSPKKDWHQFKLVKKKMADGDIELCKDYDFTSATGADSDSDKDNEYRKKRPQPKLPVPPEVSTSTKNRQSTKKLLPLLSKSPLKKPIKRPLTKPISPQFNRYSISPLKRKLEKQSKDSSPKPKKTKSIVNTSTAKKPIHSDSDENEEQPNVLSFQETPSPSLVHNQTNENENIIPKAAPPNIDTESASLESIYKIVKKQFKVILEIKNWVTRNSLDMSSIDCSFQFERLEHRASLRELEGKLADNEYKNKLVSSLGNIGGADFGDHTRSVLQRLFTNNLMKKMNFSGSNNKFGLKNTKILTLILDSVRSRFKNAVEHAILVVARNYLRNARARQNRSDE